MQLKLTEETLTQAATARAPGFAAAVRAIAQRDGDLFLVETADWHRLTVEHIKTSMGLGDLVHAVAQPIAKAIDAVAGTSIASCGGCAKRRDALNRLTE
jgi:hypothetical protein